MSGFDSIAVVDWSGGNDRGPTPKKDAIWAAVIRGGLADTPVYLRNRAVAFDWLTTLCRDEGAAGRRLMIGFDFPFGFPEGFATLLTGADDPLALWDWFAARLDDRPEANNRFALAGEINARFPGVGPFWYNGAAAEIPHLPRKGRARRDTGMAERRLAETRARGAFPCWQLGGAGAVGSQAITGMATLSRLRADIGAPLRVWPFEDIAGAQVVLSEIWPSLIGDAVKAQQTGDEVRDRAQVRVLSHALWGMQRAGDLDAALAAVPDQGRREGWILGLGFEAKLRAATAPGLGNDCFALPPGVHWTPVDSALSLLQSRMSPVCEVKTVPIAAADGRILAASPRAARANPPGANAAVDGYGFARDTLPNGAQVLPLHPGRAAAGAPFRGHVPAGHALRILTGALIPGGVDTVMLQEDCQVDGDRLRVSDLPRVGANTRRAGEDVSASAAILSPGQRLRPPDLALAAAVGVAQVPVFAPLRVGVLSTGDELCDPGATPDPASTYDANRPMLLSLAARFGHRAVDLGRVADDRAALRACLDAARGRADVVLTSGGASAGEEDHVSALLRETGSLQAWRIALKPGRPLALGIWAGMPVFGLPGNPVAALVCALIFARPALSLLAGGRWEAPMGFDVPAGFAKRKKAGRREYLRARIRDGRAEVFASEGSGRISGLSWAEGLVELAEPEIEIAPGDPVRFLPYAGFGL